MPSPTPSMRMSASGIDLLERGAHAVEIAGDRDVETGDLLAVGVEEEDVGLPDRDADHVDAARGADDRIGDLGIGDQHILDVGRQIDRDRLADAERNESRCGLARRHLDHRHMRVGRRLARRPSARGRRRAISAISAAVRINVLIAMSLTSPRSIIAVWSSCLRRNGRYSRALRLPELSSSSASLRDASVMLRSASDSVPSCCDSTSVSA